eukprot:TRINITY_DN31162_c0_g1_i1.p1 TRINITY_DN31162_c0_g1~~TRINITY_DN31162_c0_g1_i1.p1  ORF type:complete len:256 (+),score=38.56 TRINITY_DN31162_c0_g1_i1:60-827(+)
MSHVIRKIVRYIVVIHAVLSGELDSVNASELSEAQESAALDSGSCVGLEGAKSNDPSKDLEHIETIVARMAPDLKNETSKVVVGFLNGKVAMDHLTKVIAQLQQLSKSEGDGAKKIEKAKGIVAPIKRTDLKDLLSKHLEGSVDDAPIMITNVLNAAKRNTQKLGDLIDSTLTKLRLLVIDEKKGERYMFPSAPGNFDTKVTSLLKLLLLYTFPSKSQDVEDKNFAEIVKGQVSNEVINLASAVSKPGVNVAVSM